MKKLIISISIILSVLVLFSCTERIKQVWMDEMNIAPFAQGIRPFKTKSNYRNDTFSINGVNYTRGVGGITPSIFSFNLNGNARRFSAEVGVDDSANTKIPLKFYIIGDRKILFESGEMKVGDAAKKVDVDLTGIQRLGLLVIDDIGGVRNKRTYCNWANAQFEMLTDSFPTEIPNSDEKYILTPEPPARPVINSAGIFGATPGNPFLYTIAASGKRPVHFTAESLPAGLSVDSQTGIISGKVNRPGEYVVTLKVKNKFGEAQKELTIKIGDTIALTPPMGWNGWNSWESRLDREKVIASADAMVKSGLINYGWTYINIDDAWQGVRNGKLNALQPNEKFLEIKEMVDYIHSLGLKAGIYSTPYISTYASYIGGSSDYPNGGETHELIKPYKQPFMRIGKYRFEENDAFQMAEWGFDFLKYDWRIDVNSTERMWQALKNSGRDIVFSISNNAPFEKAADWARLTNMWRTGPDIKDNWNSLYTLAFTIDNWAEFAGPGHWNDPDMMILGNVTIGQEMHPTRLTPDEQYSHVSLFSLLAAPLLIGCPIEQLDDFTLGLLTNNEVIEINQDPLGKPGRLTADINGVQIWTKPLSDSSVAVGLFNVDNFGKTPESFFRWGDETDKAFDFDFEKAGFKGKWRIRDIWRQEDLGEFENNFKTRIRFHGIVLLKMIPL